MRIAIVDPSLFTLPYDAALVNGLADIGQDVRLYGRRLRADEVVSDPGLPLCTGFYPIAESSLAARLPKAGRLLVKGADHAASLLRLWQRLRVWQPDAIHFQWLPLPAIDSLFLPAFRQLAPVILTVHDTEAFNGNPTARLQGVGFLRALSGCDRLIVHTGQGRERLLRKGIDAARISVLPHGPLAAIKTDDSAEDMRGKISFVLFGKIKPYKGADILIEAFAALPPNVRDQADIRIIGVPYMDMAPLTARVAELGLAGSVTVEARFVADHEVPQVFGRGTIAVFPYREIEASGVLSLAVSQGRPILASRLGSFAENLEDGVHGVLTPPGDIAAVSQALARFINDRAFAARAAASVLALGRLAPTWRDIAGQTMRTYADAATMRLRPRHRADVAFAKDTVQ